MFVWEEEQQHELTSFITNIHRKRDALDAWRWGENDL